MKDNTNPNTKYSCFEEDTKTSTCNMYFSFNIYIYEAIYKTLYQIMFQEKLYLGYENTVNNQLVSAIFATVNVTTVLLIRYIAYR